MDVEKCWKCSTYFDTGLYDECPECVPIENPPCKECGATDIPLHTDMVCGLCKYKEGSALL